jgi:hypothetical protein
VEHTEHCVTFHLSDGDEKKIIIITLRVSLNPETWEHYTPAKPELQLHKDAAYWKLLFQGRLFHHTYVFYEKTLMGADRLLTA